MLMKSYFMTPHYVLCPLIILYDPSLEPIMILWDMFCFVCTPYWPCHKYNEQLVPSGDMVPK